MNYSPKLGERWMGRPKNSTSQEAFIYEKYYAGLGSKAIANLLEHNFPEPLSLRTVERKCAEFKKSRTPQSELLSSPFRWESMGEAGVPWEAGQYLMGLRAWFIAQEMTPTFRQMKWCWRVHSTSAKLSYEAVHALALQAEEIEFNPLQDSMTLTNALSQLRARKTEPSTDDKALKLTTWGEAVMRARSTGNKFSVWNYNLNLTTDRYLGE